MLNTISGCNYTNLEPAAAAAVAASNNQFQFARVQDTLLHKVSTDSLSYEAETTITAVLSQLRSKNLELMHHGQLKTAQECLMTARKIQSQCCAAVVIVK